MGYTVNNNMRVAAALAALVAAGAGALVAGWPDGSEQAADLARTSRRIEAQTETRDNVEGAVAGWVERWPNGWQQLADRSVASIAKAPAGQGVAHAVADQAPITTGGPDRTGEVDQNVHEVRDGVDQPEDTVADGDDGVEGVEGVEVPDEVAVDVPRRVIVTLPTYEPGRQPSVTPPAIDLGAPPSVEVGWRTTIDLGTPPSATPPTVDEGELGTFTPPSVEVE